MDSGNIFNQITRLMHRKFFYIYGIYTLDNFKKIKIIIILEGKN